MRAFWWHSIPIMTIFTRNDCENTLLSTLWNCLIAYFILHIDHLLLLFYLVCWFVHRKQKKDLELQHMQDNKTYTWFQRDRQKKKTFIKSYPWQNNNNHCEHKKTLLQQQRQHKSLDSLRRSRGMRSIIIIFLCVFFRCECRFESLLLEVRFSLLLFSTLVDHKQF